MQPSKIVALSGSLKERSLNQKLIHAAAAHIETAGAEVIHIRLNDFPMPLFSEDIEAQETPSSVNDLKAIFAEADGILIASPEYNGSMTAALKNTIDWLSRPSKSVEIGSAFAGKAVGLVATSPGALGGLRGLNHVRDVLFNLGGIISPKTVAVPSAYSIFSESGDIQDEKINTMVQQSMLALVQLTTALKGE
ncbi:NADPH-dependent FMN reductase [Algicola sagamiensis]|uniref:NADPH-dependent FMN reductase n=1 Tax=Algicola sagamiensis TaxID=163869 RepID=UPI0003778B85|nr:NAD(P)H-dependent oxidoreductase [Algicola sagamiensis]